MNISSCSSTQSTGAQEQQLLDLHAAVHVTPPLTIENEDRPVPHSRKRDDSLFYVCSIM